MSAQPLRADPHAARQGPADRKAVGTGVHGQVQGVAGVGLLIARLARRIPVPVPATEAARP